jgi:hypothetical protein
LTTDPLFHKISITVIVLRIVDTPLLWATFFLRCVPSVCRYSTGVSLLMRPGLQPECGFSSWLFIWLQCCVFIPPPWCVFGFGCALLCCVPVPGGVVRSCVCVTLRSRIKTHIIRYHTRNRMQTPQIKYERHMVTSEILTKKDS